MIRDARAEETARALQDSESLTAIEQKRMIFGLAKKGWSTIDIVSELQRVWGQDVLILPEKLDGSKNFASRMMGPSIGAIFMIPAFIYFMRKNTRAAGYVARNITAPPKVAKREIFDKLKIKR